MLIKFIKYFIQNIAILWMFVEIIDYFYKELFSRIFSIWNGCNGFWVIIIISFIIALSRLIITFVYFYRGGNQKTYFDEDSLSSELRQYIREYEKDENFDLTKQKVIKSNNNPNNISDILPCITITDDAELIFVYRGFFSPEALRFYLYNPSKNTIIVDSIIVKKIKHISFHKCSFFYVQDRFVQYHYDVKLSKKKVLLNITDDSFYYKPGDIDAFTLNFNKSESGILFKFLIIIKWLDMDTGKKHELTSRPIYYHQ